MTDFPVAFTSTQATPTKNRKETGLNRYKIIATYKGERVTFKAIAANGRQAVAEARRIAKERGMKRIFVNSVKKLDNVTIQYTPFHEAPLNALGGTCDNIDWSEIYSGMTPPTEVPTLSVDEVNEKIENAWKLLVCFAPRPDQSPLKAYELGGKVFVDDGVSGRQELYEHSLPELAILVYEWSIYAGYYSDDFEVFVKESWNN